ALSPAAAPLQARVVARPRQIRRAVAPFPHFVQRHPGIAPPSRTALLQPFDDRRDPLTEADAHRLQTKALVGPLEVVQQRGHELGAGAAERMTERDGAAVDVDAAHVWMQLALPRQDDRRERLADLDEIDLL